MAQSWRLWVVDQKMVVKILLVGTRASEVAIVHWSYDLQSTELWVEASSVMVFSVNDLVSRIVLSLGKGITSENGELQGIVKIACTVKVARIVVRWNDKSQSTESKVMVLSFEELVSRIVMSLDKGITSRRGKLRIACTIKVAGTLMEVGLLGALLKAYSTAPTFDFEYILKAVLDIPEVLRSFLRWILGIFFKKKLIKSFSEAIKFKWI